MKNFGLLYKSCQREKKKTKPKEIRVPRESGVDIDLIAKSSGLSKEEIEKL
jgi:hypothetical protein